MRLKKKWKRLLGFTAIVMMGYGGIYAINTLWGGYWAWPVISKTQYSDSGLGLPTAFLWQPRFGYRDPAENTFLGWLFAPAIAVDRQWFHRTLDLVNEEDEKVIFSEFVKWHPTSLAQAKAQVKKRALRTREQSTIGNSLPDPSPSNSISKASSK